MKIDLLKKHTDKRGELVEFLKVNEIGKKKFGQIYFVTFKDANVVRGNHYHRRTTEWFGIANGSVYVKMMNLKTKKTMEEWLTAGSYTYKRLMIEPMVAHAFLSMAPNTVLLNYTDRVWSPKDRHEYKLL